MGNVIYTKSEAEVVIFVDQNGNDTTTGEYVCEPEDAQPVITIDLNGDES